MVEALNSYFHWQNIFLAISATVLKNFFCQLREKKIVLDCFYLQLSRLRKIFMDFKFLICLKVVFVCFKRLFFIGFGYKGKNFVSAADDSA